MAPVSVLNLAVSRWTIFADVYPSPLTPSPVALTGGQFAASADALAGDDRVTGTGNNAVIGGVGSLLSNGRFYMSLGCDRFSGTGAAGDAAVGTGINGNAGSTGIHLTEGSILNTGVTVRLSVPDDDTVAGTGGAGSAGSAGDNAAVSTNNAGQNGGAGGAGGVGINVECGSELLTGDGRDSITGTGGAGGAGAGGGTGDGLGVGGNGGDGGNGGAGIYVSSTSLIDMGTGADSITGIGGLGALGGAGGTGFGGSSPTGANGSNGAAIYNRGKIYMGTGRDTIDALSGGFDGCGSYYMGRDNDTVKGFGKGTFYGESGLDTLVLPGTGADYTSITLIDGVQGNYSIVKGGTTMTALSFENLTFTGV